MYVYADPSAGNVKGTVKFSLKTSHEGTVIATETRSVNTIESNYSLRFPTQSAGKYYFEMESILEDNNIALKVRESSTYEGGKIWMHDGDWTSPSDEDLEMKLLSPPYIKLSPVITKEHIAVQTGAVVKGLCEECPDAEYFEKKGLFESEASDIEIEITGTKVIGQRIDIGIRVITLTPPSVQKLLNSMEIPLRNVSITRALAKLTLYNDITKTIVHSQVLIPVPPASTNWISAYFPVSAYSNDTAVYYWELEAVSGTFTTQAKSGLYAGLEAVTSYENGVLVEDKHFATYYVRGKCCTGWARYPERLLRNSADITDFEAPEPAEYGLRGEREIQVDFHSDWIKNQSLPLTRCRSLAKEHVFKHNYPSYSAEFSIIGGYVHALVGLYVLLYNPYEGQDQTFLVTEQEHDFKKGWNSLITSFVAIRSGNKP